MGKRKRLARRLQQGHAVDVHLTSGHLPVLVEVAPDGVYAYAGCCGERVDRHTVLRLHRALGAWLDLTA